MFDLIKFLFLALIVGFTIYGILRLIVEFEGCRFTPEAEQTLDALWSYIDKKLVISILSEYSGKNIRKMRREMKPAIVSIALESALEDLKTKGENSKIFSLLEKRAKLVSVQLGNKNL